jgi:hypothetical protein
MESARYHRARAELCLQMARHMSDPASANLLRANATRHFALATELENQEALARPVLKKLRSYDPMISTPPAAP